MDNIKNSMPTAKNGGHRLKNDIIFIVILLIAVSVIGLCYFFMRGEGDTVVVTVDGKPFGEYSLSETRRVDIKTGDNYNVLVIEGGEAHMESASCPDGICVAHKPVSRDGESIICLPNKVVAAVRATDDEDRPDIIS